MKQNFFKWLLLSLTAIIITGAVVGYKMYNKPHRNVVNADAVAVKAEVLVTLYETDENKANRQYLDKVLNVSGEVAGIAKNQKGETVITLKGSGLGGVICTLEGREPWEVKQGSAIKIQGICTGYLTDVVLVRCYFN
jgi:hypothetical protein